LTDSLFVLFGFEAGRDEQNSPWYIIVRIRVYVQISS